MANSACPPIAIVRCGGERPGGEDVATDLRACVRHDCLREEGSEVEHAGVFDSDCHDGLLLWGIDWAYSTAFSARLRRFGAAIVRPRPAAPG